MIHQATSPGRILPDRNHILSLVMLLLLVWPTTNSLHGQEATKSVSFRQDIRPLLSDRCFSCHGPDESTREANLRLDDPDSAYEIAISPGSVDSSELWARIVSTDEDSVMPPPNAHKPSFTPEELAKIRQWIQQGANYETFWAFSPVRSPQLPAPQTLPDRWSKHPIDRLVAQSFKEKGLTPAAEADARTLARRVSLDVTGLPPTRKTLHWFLELEQTTGREVALEQLIDRLLDSPQYGEHIGRFWLDLVRFADTNGMHKDFYRNHFAYRDWVIRAYNEDLGFDKFATYQIAGDLLENPTQDQLTATAFHRLHLIIDRGTALPEESFHKNVVDRVTAFSTAFLGLTAHCAQCHDHKYDPISQKEFYSLYAFFNNIDAQPETVARPKNGLQAPFISLATPEQQQKLDEYTNTIKSLDQQLVQTKKARQEVDTLLKDATDEQKEKLQAQIAKHKQDESRLSQQKRSATNARSQFDRNVSYVMVMKERKQPRPTHVLIRGQYDSPGELVQRDTPAFLPSLNPSPEGATRLDLARWLTAPQNPLAGRVAVNRIWQQLFGVGLVKTAEDFGSQGSPPSHPELLEYLTMRFVDSGWKTKPLIKHILMSQTYRQSSLATQTAYAADPDNTQLTRGSRYRLDAEMIRDQILLTSDQLVNKLYGPSVKPPQPDGLWKAVTMIGERYQADVGDAIYRRSLYTYWKRGMPPPQMTILNAPARDACIARRERTNTPSQALLLLNEPEYLKAARALAEKVLQQPKDQRIVFAWETVTCQRPDADEQKVIRQLLTEMKTRYQASPELLKQFGDDTKATPQLAAWTLVINTLYNLDITKNRD